MRVGKNDLDFASVISSNESDYHCYYYSIYRMQSSLLDQVLTSFISFKVGNSPGWVAPWVRVPSCSTPKSSGLDFQSGYMPRLQVPSPVGVHVGSNQWMFLSLSLSLSQINKHILCGGLIKMSNNPLGRDFCYPCL